MLFNVPSFAAGFATGFATGFVSREVVRVGRDSLRPVAKAVIRGGMVAFEKTREAFAVAGETFEDLVAEARAEAHAVGAVDAQAAEASAAATTAVPAPDDSKPAETGAADKAAAQGHA